MTIVLILLSVGMICVGQVLFKLVGLRLTSGLPLLSMQVIGVLSLALAIYGLATLLWVYVLKFVPLSKAYPYMALCFVVVPLLGVAFLSEKVNLQYVVGIACIVVGVVIAGKA